MTAILQADSFIQTEDCDGPRYGPNAPSRETPGVIMTGLQDKYITEFELPYRNVERYIKEIGNNWNRLDDKQRALIKQSFQNMGMVGKIENFANTSSPTDVTSFIKFLAAKPNENTKVFMDTLWNTTPDQLTQLGLTKEQVDKVKDSMYEWSVDNTYVLHCNWRSGSVLFFLLLILFCLIIALAVVGGNKQSGGTGNGFGSNFGRRF